MLKEMSKGQEQKKKMTGRELQRLVYSSAVLESKAEEETIYSTLDPEKVSSTLERSFDYSSLGNTARLINKPGFTCSLIYINLFNQGKKNQGPTTYNILVFYSINIPSILENFCFILDLFLKYFIQREEYFKCTMIP